MRRELRLLNVGLAPSKRDIAAIAAILDAPDHAVLPLHGSTGSAHRALSAELDKPLPAYDEPTVLAIATTGSTGAPKLVLHGESSLRASIEATADRMGGHGQWLLALPLPHIAGLQVVLRSSVAGQDVVVLPGGTEFDIGFAEAVGRMSGPRKYTSLVPTQLLRLLGSDAGRAGLADLDAVLLGGAAAEPALVDEARALGVDVLTTYGMSETAGGCVYDGVPLDGVDIGLDHGIIVLRGPVLAQGYRTPLPDDPFRDGGFVTSDLGEIVDGRLRVLGRADDLIVTGGKKVAPPRVERALRALPAISDAVVVGVPDAEWGERVAALVVGPPRELDALRDELRGVLESFELPREVRYVDAVPLQGIGKPDRQAARRAFTER